MYGLIDRFERRRYRRIYVEDVLRVSAFPCNGSRAPFHRKRAGKREERSQADGQKFRCTPQSILSRKICPSADGPPTVGAPAPRARVKPPSLRAFIDADRGQPPILFFRFGAARKSRRAGEFVAKPPPSRFAFSTDYIYASPTLSTTHITIFR